MRARAKPTRVDRRSAAAATVLLACWSVGPAIAAPAAAPPLTVRDQLIGSWTLDSQYMKYQDGRTFEPYGPNTKGSLMLDEFGRFSFQVIGASRPLFRSGARREGTAEENAAAVSNTETFFGMYSVDEAKRMLILHLERAILPNWDGVDRTYRVVLDGDHLQLVGPPTPSASGPMIPHTAWTRVKPRRRS